MAKLKKDSNDKDKLIFNCPGCKGVHGVNVNYAKRPRWKWNGDMDKPTFKPSLLVTWGGLTKKCHSYIKDGYIQFLTDCTHELAGQTIEIPEWDD